MKESQKAIQHKQMAEGEKYKKMNEQIETNRRHTKTTHRRRVQGKKRTPERYQKKQNANSLISKLLPAFELCSLHSSILSLLVAF